MPYVTIAKQFTFDAAHHIDAFPEGHKCRRMHGHTYVVELQFRGAVNPATGLCDGIDYADIADAMQPILNMLDHRVLNEIEGLEIPTTEMLVSWIAGRFFALWRSSMYHRLCEALSTVRVQESSTTWCDLHVSLAGMAEAGDLP